MRFVAAREILTSCKFDVCVCVFARDVYFCELRSETWLFVSGFFPVSGSKWHESVPRGLTLVPFVAPPFLERQRGTERHMIVVVQTVRVGF